MSYTVKRYLKWFLTNGFVVAALLSPIEGFVTLATILLWFTSVVGMLMLSTSIARAVVEAIVKDEVTDSPLVINQYLSHTFDLLLMVYIAYIGQPFLAAAYLAHIVGIANLYKAQEEIFLEKLKGE